MLGFHEPRTIDLGLIPQKNFLTKLASSLYLLASVLSVTTIGFKLRSL